MTDTLADNRPDNATGSASAPARRILPTTPGGIALVFERYGLVMLVALMIVVFAILPSSGEAFRSPLNVRAILSNQAVGLVVALAILVPFAAGFFDFSVGATTVTASVIAATSLSRFGLPLPVAILLAVAVAALLGLGIGFLVAYLGFNPFIATLGVATLLGGAVFAYTEGLQITSGIPAALTDFGSRDVLGIPRIIIVAALIAVIVWFVTTRTVFGRRLFATGSNPRATQLIGVNVRHVQLAAFTVAGLLAGIAGVLLLARQGSATSDNGMTMLFPALTAVLLSTIVIELGRPSVVGTIVGILFVAVSVSGLTLAGAPAWVGPVFNGGALLIAVGFARLSRGRKQA